jgi:DNA mismatch repair ATPase MutS
MANFAYNNPDFVYPQINNQLDINFEHLGHPLIAQSKRVTNSISFENEQFFILTGSNMSGKSTFLRTVGLNMVLAGIGAPVCASNASVHPLPVLVSMRLSDSLSDSESYFYAEVKRLKYIMEQLENEACFVLLDEILRGTNSDDKREGTMEVVRKMAHHNVFGGIATHDLEVCTVSAEFPKTLTNKRFEVAIVNDELLFDYKLQDGICQNKSASFIMKKMGVI